MIDKSYRDENTFNIGKLNPREVVTLQCMKRIELKRK